MQPKLLIMVGGGPAPGINGVISSVTIEALKRGIEVWGLQGGLFGLEQNGIAACRKLEFADVTDIHRDGGSIIGTSREGPNSFTRVANLIAEFGAEYVVCIGGDGTISASYQLELAAHGRFSVGHVPKTIDNDIPLPGGFSTFGFQSAREHGTNLVEALAVDAKTTDRWYLVVAMGRKVGHLSLGIAISAGATLAIIPEEFGVRKIQLDELVDIIVGSMLKRFVNGKKYGTVVLAEGLAEIIDPNSVPELAAVERDTHGGIRFRELEFGQLVKRAARERLAKINLKLTVIEKNVGYELRCQRPNAFDIEYTRQLGYGVVRGLVTEKQSGMVIREVGDLRLIPFKDIIDEKTGRVVPRRVNIESTLYKVSREYMIRLEKSDLTKEFISKAEALGLRL